MQIKSGLPGAGLHIQDLREGQQSIIALAHQTDNNEKLLAVRKIFLSRTTRQDKFLLSPESVILNYLALCRQMPRSDKLYLLF